MKHLVLGGARSGKSHFAEQTAGEQDKQLHYVATAQARDSEMAARIVHHQHQRDSGWTLLEEPVHLATALNSINHSTNCIVIDCLTTGPLKSTSVRVESSGPLPVYIQARHMQLQSLCLVSWRNNFKDRLHIHKFVFA